MERKEVLDDMTKHLGSPTDSLSPTCFVLQGMGGGGKSQLALKYCEILQRKDSSAHILWIDATSVLTARQSVAMIAQRISPGVDTSDDEANL